MCDQKGASVSAVAEMVLSEQEVPALEVEVPDLGTIRVAEVSATTVIYLDPLRGLVSRSV